ncbi:FtsW/RodA/SpoVE family cell cycle protein [Arcobacter sp. 15-2]|uniref:FtsW/RodA/SpoVE family cell cycle protein n=1 Tax=Arcobacter sp. 15-2 TaxID=3374109 RepID=UPI00399D4EEF
MNFIQKKIKSLSDDNQPDYILFYLSSLLIIISILFSYSLSIYTVIYWDYEPFHFFYRQLFTGLLAILIMWTLAQINPDILIPKLGWFLFIFFLFLIVIMQFLPSSLVTESGGAKRWIRLPGISLSPVEFFKIGFIYYLSWSFHRKLTDISKQPFKEELKLLAPYAIVFGFVVFMIAVLQKDLGQVVLLATTLFIMLIFANRSWKVFASLFAIAIIGLIALILVFPHRIIRIKSWWSMVQDSVLSIMPDFVATALRIKEFPEPYQVGHSLNAINNGGFFGVGLGNGSLKLGFLSEVHTDFVLAGITEEIGFLGFLFILLILFGVIFRIFRTSRRILDTKYHLFTIGIGLMISIAFLINSYGISGIIPIKGIAVPFLSYGGSSLLSVAIAVGLVLSISRNIEQKR